MARSSSPAHDAPTPLPWAQLSLLFVVQLAEPITYTIIFPFISQLAIELGVTDDPSKTGYFVGLIESVFFLTQAACVLHWGQLSDRIGRRPILIVGLSGLALSQICFGLASGRHGSFVAVIAARAVAGALNGNVGVIKSAMGELTDETNAARAMSLMPIIWNVGGSIGPLLGGGLAHPYERFPGSVFAKLEFFKEYPYILPCGSAALFSLFACAVTAIWFREPSEPLREDYWPSDSSSTTIHPDNEGLETPACSAMPIQPAASGDYSPTPTVHVSATTSPIGERTPLLAHQHTVANVSTTHSASRLSVREIMTPRLRAALVAYSLLAITEVSYLALQPLYLSSPTSAGGLGLSATTIGIWMGGAGALNAFVQAVAYPRMQARWGKQRLFIAGASAYVLMWPVWIVGWVVAVQLNSATSHEVHWSTAPGASWVWALVASSFALYMMAEFCYAGIFQFVNNAAPRRALGTANGLAQTCASTMRAIGPVTLTSLWSWSAGYLHRADATTIEHLPPVSAAIFSAGPVAMNLASTQVRPVEVGGVAVPWQAATVYVAIELLSIALVWAGTRLSEGHSSKTKPESTMRTLPEDETA